MSATRGAILAISMAAALTACKPRGTTQPPNPAVWGEPGTEHFQGRVIDVLFTQGLERVHQERGTGGEARGFFIGSVL